MGWNKVKYAQNARNHVPTDLLVRKHPDRFPRGEAVMGIAQSNSHD